LRLIDTERNAVTKSNLNLPADIIKGGMCISSMRDLTPVRLSARSRYVAFYDVTVAALSPLRHLDRLHAPLVVAYGTCETPEFQRQNREFAAAVEARGKVVELLVRRALQPFRVTRNARQPVWSAWTCGTRPDGLVIGDAIAGRFQLTPVLGDALVLSTPGASCYA
jgi:hypothetical protein